MVSEMRRLDLSGVFVMTKEGCDEMRCIMSEMKCVMTEVRFDD